MMVIAAMATGLVLSTAYVASRTNGAVIGANLTASSQARVEAESALALTISALTSDDDWRTRHRQGVLMERNEDDLQVRVELVDLATDGPPDQSTVDVRAMVTCRVRGIERVAEAEFFIALPEQARSLDVDLGEFAMFAGDSITVRSEAIVEPWPASPAIGRGDPIRVATSLGNSGGVTLGGSAAIVRGVEYASGARRNDSGPLPVAGIPDVVAVPRPAPPPDLGHARHRSMDADRIDEDTRVDTLSIQGARTIELARGADLIVEGDLDLAAGATLRVSGESQLVVLGDVRITDANIMVEGSAALVMHVGGDLDFRHAKITEPEGTADTWVPDLDRVRFVGLMRRESLPTWRVRGRSLVKGEFYAPDVNFKLQGRAVLVGRIVAQTVLAEGRSCLLYDPALDDRNGYTAVDRRAYDTRGDLLPALAALVDLGPESLATAAGSLGFPVAAGPEPTEAVVPAPSVACAQHLPNEGYFRGHRRARAVPRLWSGGHHGNQRHANWSMNIVHIGAPGGPR